MSVFALREWWAVQPAADEEYDSNSICTLPSGNIVLGSFQGVLRVYAPAHGEFRADQLLVETRTVAILQVAAGTFTYSTSQTLAVLHPRSLQVFLVGPTALRLAHEIQFTRNAFNFTYGKFGSYSKEGCDSICVQSSDGALGFYEQDSYVFAVQLPGFLVPGPFTYCPFNDSFLLCNSNMEIECYKFSRLKDAYSSYKQGSEQSFEAEWTINVGEYCSDIVCATVQGLVDVYILGEHTLFGIKQTGNLRLQKRLDYTPSCMCIYGKESVIIGSFSGHMLVYRQNNLAWAAKMNSVPVAIRVVDYDTPGLVLSLSSAGEVEVSYLGTAPMAYSLAAPAKHLDYSGMDQEYRRVMGLLNTASDVQEPGERLDLRVQLHAVGRDLHTYEGYASDSEGTIVTRAALFLTVTGGTASNITVQVVTPGNIYCAQSSFSMEHLKSTQLELEFLTVAEYPASSLEVSVVASYFIGDSARIAKTEFSLPILQIGEIVKPLKEAEYKITLIATSTLPSLAELFSEFKLSTPNAVSLRYFNGSHATIIIGKSGGRYRVQGSDLEALWPLTNELCTRAGFSSFSLEEAIPFKDFFDILDTHFNCRVTEKNQLEGLEKLSQQYASIQKRLLVRFKDKNPAPLNNLDFLLQVTHSQLAQLAEELQDTQYHLQVTSLRLSSAISIIILLLRLRFALDINTVNSLKKFLSHKVVDTASWEEICTANMTFLLKTALAKNSKEQAASSGNLAFPVSTEKLKKHITIVCDRIAKGARLS